ncbi:MAG TPA: trypsin-like serine protease [Acidimicrobiia bacterium]|nr:trypsin-like serine protease [Acidimicrobiia bacterium]
MRRMRLAVFAAILGLTLALPAGAITNGELDGNDHPYVGIMVADAADGTPMWRCSGALISPTVYVTAGHCVEAPAEGVTIWFETDLHADPTGDRFGYPFSGETSVEGTPYPYPAYDPDAFYLYDLGVVVLDEPVELNEYASLPGVDYVDSLGKGRKRAVVTAVGYGLQKATSNPAGPDRTQAALTRYQADLFVVNTTGVAGIGPIPDSHSMVLSGDAKHGGTCFGDSGGPILDGDVIVAVNSFALNANCAGIGGVFRIDRQAELDWISGFLN